MRTGSLTPNVGASGACGDPVKDDMTTTPNLDFVSIDLDQERARRAAQREVQAETLPIRLGGEVIASIPTELPLDVLAPLRRLDEEITLLLRSVMQMMNSESDEQVQKDALGLVIDILAANPALPNTVIEVIEEMCKRLLGKDGFKRLMDLRLTRDDVAFLARRVFEFYGFSLGESQPSSTSSTTGQQDGGTTSLPTSGITTTDSMPEASGDAPESPASSEPASS